MGNLLSSTQPKYDALIEFAVKAALPSQVNNIAMSCILYLDGCTYVQKENKLSGVGRHKTLQAFRLIKTGNSNTKEMGMETSLHLESVRAVNALKTGILVVKIDVHTKTILTFPVRHYQYSFLKLRNKLKAI